MEIFSHPCIKCKKIYKDTDPDAYYCSPCNEERKKIAQAIDEKLKGTVSKKQVKSDIQSYNEIIQKTGSPFVRAADLGITF